MTILVTGGAGYIGSHACLELLSAGYPVVVVDNLSNSNVESLKRVQRITGKSLVFHQVDLRDKIALSAILTPATFRPSFTLPALRLWGNPFRFRFGIIRTTSRQPFSCAKS